MGFVITIDGPAASGKSSVSRELAKKLNIPWVSTGSFYRGLGYAAIESKIDLKDPIALSELCHSSTWKIEMTPEKTLVWFGEKNVTDLVAQEHVGNVASQISHYPEVRQSLLDHQRNCAVDRDGLIAEGRDCGTVVFPHAEVKIFLTARSDSRAQRRAEELGIDKKVTADLQKTRDEQDSTRKTAPLSVPKDALVIDTTELSLDDVVDQVLKYTHGKI
jgi:cytidylate kinase